MSILHYYRVIYTLFEKDDVARFSETVISEQIGLIPPFVPQVGTTVTDCGYSFTVVDTETILRKRSTIVEVKIKSKED